MVLKVELGYRTKTLTPVGLEGFVPGEHPISRFTMFCKDVTIATEVPCNMQHWKCIFGKKRRRKTAIRGENVAASADGFP